jgi:hypothetical protein
MANASTTPIAAPTRLGWRVPAVRLGGLVFERTGAYDAVWWLAVLFGVLSAVINLPIVEKPVQRLAPAAAT